MKHCYLVLGLLLSTGLSLQAQVWKGDVTMSIGNNALLTVEGNLQLTAGTGANALVSAGTLAIRGNLTGTGEYRSPLPGDTVRFEGTAAQSINLANIPTGLGFLEIANAAGLDLLSIVSIREGVVFTNGRIRTTSANILRIGDLAQSFGDGPTSYVDGPLRVSRAVGGQPFYFPIGNGTVYRPVLLNDNAAFPNNLELDLRLLAGASATPINGSSRINRISGNYYYLLERVTGGSNLPGPFSLRFRYGTEEGLTVANARYYRMAYSQNGGNFDSLAVARYGALLPADSVTVRTLAGTQNGPFTFALGVARSQAISPQFVAPAANPVNVGDILQLQLASALPPGASLDWEVSQPLGSPFTSTGTATTTFNVPPVFEERAYRTVVTEPDREPGTSPDFQVLLAPYQAINLQVLLQGPHVDGTSTMTSPLTPATLRTNNPGVYPAPTGDVPATTVDAVTVELRQGATAQAAADAGAPVAARIKTAWVSENGQTFDFRTGNLAGQPYVYFSNVPDGNYYVVVKHRNHLAMMSATPVALSAYPSTPPAVDLRDPGNVFVNNTFMEAGGYLDAAANVMMLFAGNPRNETPVNYQLVNAIDFSNVSLTALTTPTGYLIGDVNLDGVVNMSDYVKAALNSDVVTVSSVRE